MQANSTSRLRHVGAKVKGSFSKLFRFIREIPSFISADSPDMNTLFLIAGQGIQVYIYYHLFVTFRPYLYYLRLGRFIKSLRFVGYYYGDKMYFVPSVNGLIMFNLSLLYVRFKPKMVFKATFPDRLAAFLEYFYTICMLFGQDTSLMLALSEPISRGHLLRTWGAPYHHKTVLLKEGRIPPFHMKLWRDKKVLPLGLRWEHSRTGVLMNSPLLIFPLYKFQYFDKFFGYKLFESFFYYVLWYSWARNPSGTDFRRYHRTNIGFFYCTAVLLQTLISVELPYLLASKTAKFRFSNSVQVYVFVFPFIFWMLSCALCALFGVTRSLPLLHETCIESLSGEEFYED